MSIVDQITYIRDELHDWASALGGGCEVAGDIVHAFALLQHKPGTVRCVVWLSGEEKRGDYEEAGFVDRQFTVFISRGRGFTLEPGDSLTARTAGNAEPLYDLVEEARQVIRGLQFAVDETEVTPNFKSIRPFAFPTERPVDAYQIEFSLGSELDTTMPAKGLFVYSGLQAVSADQTNILIAPATEQYDDWGAYSAGVFTAPAEGNYHIECAFMVNGAEGGDMELRFTDGSAVPVPFVGPIATPDGQSTTMSISTVVKLAQGAIVRFWAARNGNAVNLNFVVIKIHKL